MGERLQVLGKHLAFQRSSPVKERTVYLKEGQRIAWLEAFKGIAACIIVGHHLSEYSPSSDLADQFAPNLMYGIYNYGLFVVHLFLVLGGFALAIAMPDHPLSWRKALSAFGARYVRLATPYVAMLVLLILASWSTLSVGMDPPLVDSFSWWQFLAHIFFLQDVLGYGNLSAGTWYLCIDLQFVGLFHLLQAILHTFGKITKRELLGPAAMSTILFPLGIVSLWYWSRVTENEIFVFYFLSSLVFGAIVGWTVQGRLIWLAFPLYSIAMATSLVEEFRPRVLVALISGLSIYIAVRMGQKFPAPPLLIWLGKISYSLFLIHYLVNGLVLHGLNSWVGQSPFRAFASMGIAFLSSLAAAVLLHFWVEAPCHRWVKRTWAKGN